MQQKLNFPFVSTDFFKLNIQSSILSMERRLLDSGAILAKEEDVKELLEGLVRMETGP